ncbi:MAG TPA: pyridoxamine 5'-phosphate oxidase family protein [Polyangiaceae bacterium]|nr:pyridoxamine 5'-phosphate oxidase family protein [Polyangiaceae bacterium]
MEGPVRFAVTPQTKVHRSPARATYDRAAAHAILDEALVATVAFSDADQPYAIPMTFARLGDRLLLHAASSSRFAAVLGAGAPLCVTVTLLDGLVLARSAMHHSLNYRSVVVLGVASELTNAAEKLAALARLTDHALPGRSAACRPPNAVELKATRVFALPLEAVSVKRRTGGPLDDAEDLTLPYWAGVVPLGRGATAPIPDAVHAPLGAEPAGLRDYDRAAMLAAVAGEERA